MFNAESALLRAEKLVSLKSILEDEYIKDLVFERNHTLETGKQISTIWVEQSNISVSNRANWDEIFNFFNLNMSHFEAFFSEYEDYIKDI